MLLLSWFSATFTYYSNYICALEYGYIRQLASDLEFKQNSPLEIKKICAGYIVPACSEWGRAILLMSFAAIIFRTEVKYPG